MTDIQFISKLDECRPTNQSTSMHKQREKETTQKLKKYTKLQVYISNKTLQVCDNKTKITYIQLIKYHRRCGAKMEPEN